MLDYKATVQNIITLVAQKKGSYQKYSDMDQLQIGKCSHENGNSKTLTHFKSTFPGLKKTLRTFKRQHQKQRRFSKV